jgi:hypothetical protein
MRGEVRMAGSSAAAGRENQPRVVLSELRKISSVKLALHNAYFFRGSTTPSKPDAIERFESALLCCQLSVDDERSKRPIMIGDRHEPE